MEEYMQLILSKYPDQYTEELITSTIMPKLETASPIILRSLKKFLTDGVIDEIVLLGYSVEKLVNEHGMNELAAFLTLAWIIREPQEAIESLRKGHDTIIKTS